MNALAARIAATPSDPPQELQKALVEAECAVLNTPFIFVADAIAFLDFAYREAGAGNELRLSELPDLRPALIAAQERIESLEAGLCRHQGHAVMKIAALALLGLLAIPPPAHAIMGTPYTCEGKITQTTCNGFFCVVDPQAPVINIGKEKRCQGYGMGIEINGLLTVCPIGSICRVILRQDPFTVLKIRRLPSNLQNQILR